MISKVTFQISFMLRNWSYPSSSWLDRLRISDRKFVNHTTEMILWSMILIYKGLLKNYMISYDCKTIEHNTLNFSTNVTWFNVTYHLTGAIYRLYFLKVYDISHFAIICKWYVENHKAFGCVIHIAPSTVGVCKYIPTWWIMFWKNNNK